MLSGRDREPLPGAAAGMADPHLPGGCRIGDVPAGAPFSPPRGGPAGMRTITPRPRRWPCGGRAAGRPCLLPGAACPRNADVSLRGIPGPGTGRDRV